MSDVSVLALPAVAPREPVVPARVVPVVLVVPVRLPLEPQPPAPAQPRIKVPLVPSPLPLLALEAVEAGPLQHSRQSSSAAMAASSPSLEEPTYGLVPKSRWPPKGRPCPSS